MKVVIPDSVVVTETEDGGVVVNAATREELRLDRNAMTIWKALAATETLDAASQLLCDQSGTADRELQSELGSLVAKLANLELIRIVDGGGALWGLGRLRDSAFGHWVGRSAFGIREWAGWWLDARFDRSYGTDTSGIVDVTSIGCDAVDFELPAEDLVLYFCTPFDGRVFDDVLARISASLMLDPRRLILLAYDSRKDHVAKLAVQPFVTRRREIPLRCELTRVKQRRLHVFASD